MIICVIILYFFSFMTSHFDLILKGQYTMGPLNIFLFDFHENWLIKDKGPSNRFVCWAEMLIRIRVGSGFNPELDPTSGLCLIRIGFLDLSVGLGSGQH